MAFLKLCGEIQLQGKTHIGLLITAVRASLGLFSAPSYWAVHLQLSQTCFCSGGFGVLYMRACFKNIFWLKLTFFPCRYSYSYTILNQKMWGNVKIICVYVYACACVCVCMCMCVHVRVWCLCGGRGMCIISSPTRGSWLRPHQANTHGLELPSRIGTLHNHISKLQVTEVNV